MALLLGLSIVRAHILIGLRRFFFSGRRRHTRYWRDWSSDVCSSDLDALAVAAQLVLGALDGGGEGGPVPVVRHDAQRRPFPRRARAQRGERPGGQRFRVERSEERRVGTGCRARRSPIRADTSGSPWS